MSSPQPYQLAQTLHGHASDVRNINNPNPSLPILLSASRDGSAILWSPSSSKPGEWDVSMRVEGPEKKFVSCVGMTRWNGEAYLLTGSSSGILSSFALPSPSSPPPREGELQEPVHTLVEHGGNLCCLDVSKGGLIATGSWDKSVVIWKDFKKVIKISKHEQAVWAVRFVGEDRILTAAADNKIIFHSIDIASKRSTPLQEYTGHTQPVRGLSLRTDGTGFWSCGNDSNVNLYSFDKTAPIRSLSGHTSFVYSISALPDGSGAISSGEDGTLRVWSETDLVQTIPHTANSLWSCTTVPQPTGSGYYIASAANDATIRLFTRQEELMASVAEREAWDKEISGRQLDKSQVGDVKQSDLPGIEALGREGKKDGQILMLKNEGIVEAYSWSASSSSWQKVGRVVDAVGSGRRQLYEGQEWDFVFDVDVAEGMPPLKLPYNASENPWVAAQRFLNKHELPTSYGDQVVDFIHKNTAGVEIGTGGGETGGYVDPFTGGSRYTGATNGAGSSTGYSDPFTGGSAYSSTPAPPVPKTKGILPVKTYLSFKQMNIAAAKTKITQLNNEIKSSTPDLAFSAEDEKNMSEIYALLSQPAVALPNVNTRDAAERYDPVSFLNIVSRWPEAQRFPLIDLTRSLSAISPILGSTPSLPQTLLSSCNWHEPWQSAKPRETNTLLALRALANLFSTKNGRGTMCGAAGELLGELRKGRTWAELGARKVPLVTIALNYSITAISGELDARHGSALLDLIAFVLENESSDGETIYRGAVALGNLLVSPCAGSVQVGTVQGARGLVKDRAGKLGEKRLTELVAEIDSI